MVASVSHCHRLPINRECQTSWGGQVVAVPLLLLVNTYVGYKVSICVHNLEQIRTIIDIVGVLFDD